MEQDRCLRALIKGIPSRAVSVPSGGNVPESNLTFFIVITCKFVRSNQSESVPLSLYSLSIVNSVSEVNVNSEGGIVPLKPPNERIKTFFKLVNPERSSGKKPRFGVDPPYRYKDSHVSLGKLLSSGGKPPPGIALDENRHYI